MDMATSLYSCFVTWALLMQAATAVKAPPSFHWDWQNAQELSTTQSLRNIEITDAEKDAIAKAIENQIRPDMADFGIESESQFKDAVMSSRIKMIDLNSDGTPEVVAQAMVACGASGNCPFWIFQKDTGGYKLLLDDQAETFTIQGNTNGFKDIVLSYHDSAFESGVDLYRYKEGQYHDVGCYTATVAVEEGGAIQRLKEPRLAPCPVK